MDLTVYEEQLLEGRYGDTVKKLMEIMIRVGEMNGAKRLIPVQSVHLASTAIYAICGDAGMEVLASLGASGIQFAVLTLTDPISIDIAEWKGCGISEEFARKQLVAVEALQKLGAAATYTCTPYLSGYSPKRGDHLAWVETSAVACANSYYGARSNREVDVSALASAICGRTPEYGLHLPENRVGSVLVRVETDLLTLSDYGALGYYIGRAVGSAIPVLAGVPTEIDLHSVIGLGASLATSGQVALFHIEGMTPEAQTRQQAFGGRAPQGELVCGKRELREAYERLTTSSTDQVDYVALGCPHCTLEEMRDIANALRGRRVSANVEFHVFTSQSTRVIAERSGFVAAIEQAGGRVIVDTCMVNIPTTYSHSKVMATDSAKAAYYVPGFGLGDAAVETRAIYGTRNQCVAAAIAGKWRS
jgi:predicted aconitase